MVENSTTILVSIGGSLLVNIISVVLQHQMGEQAETQRNIESWYRDVVLECNNIRRTCLNMSPGVELDSSTLDPIEEDEEVRIDELKSGIEQLYQMCSETPTGADDDIVQSIRDLRNWLQQPDYQSEHPTTTEIRVEVREQVDSIMERIYDESSEMNNFPY